MKVSSGLMVTLLLVLGCAVVCQAQELTPEMQAKIDAAAKQFATLGTDAKVIAAVQAYNADPGQEAKIMTNDKWKKLSLLDPFVKSLAKNDLSGYLKGKVNDMVSELFVSGADGGKVCFFSKTTYWNHTGKPKHDLPMAGKTWQGPVEVDESTGQTQVQISFPVIADNKPIGSIVIGLQVSKLKETK